MRSATTSACSKTKSSTSKSTTGAASVASHERERVRVKKRFGQHFLAPVWADKVVNAIEPTSADTFIEIGPGPGILTERLAARAAHVVAFEIDRDLVATLRDSEIPRTTIVQGDFLDVT